MKEFINEILREEEKIITKLSIFSGIFTQVPYKECLKIEWSIYETMQLVSDTLELKLTYG